MRTLSSAEQDKIKALTGFSVPLAFLEPTLTGLGKSIMDATSPVRQYLMEQGLHNFGEQEQGQEHKVLLDAVLIDSNSSKKAMVSLYRPATKKGDPRIWFSGLKSFVAPNEILALIALDGKVYVLNLTRLPVLDLLRTRLSNPLQELATEIQTRDGVIASELLGLLRNIAARGPVRAELTADTAVGRTLETLLGIGINSSKQPDYKGIELKAFRRSKGNRKNLFAQVPDWANSKLKSSSAILDAFGYDKGSDFKLYCTVSAITANSQGLSLRLDRDISVLHENSLDPSLGDFVQWQLQLLHERLLEKHNETFWISANPHLEDGFEYLHYTSVEHTRKPILSQFDLLVEQGIITMDHLIKRNSKGKTVEKGPLFKIKPQCVGLLFPPSKTYDLLGK